MDGHTNEMHRNITPSVFQSQLFLLNPSTISKEKEDEREEEGEENKETSPQGTAVLVSCVGLALTRSTT